MPLKPYVQRAVRLAGQGVLFCQSRSLATYLPIRANQSAYTRIIRTFAAPHRHHLFAKDNPPVCPSEACLSEPTSNRPALTRYPTVRTTAAATAFSRPVPTTLAPQRRPTTTANLQAPPTQIFPRLKAPPRASCRTNRAHTSCCRA